LSFPQYLCIEELIGYFQYFNIQKYEKAKKTILKILKKKDQGIESEAYWTMQLSFQETITLPKVRLCPTALLEMKRMMKNKTKNQ
jgi:hypothetical protein